MRLNYPIFLYANGQRMLPQTAKLGAKPIADDAINDECPIDLARSRENLSAWQISPFVRANDPTGLHPAIIWIQIRNQIGSRRSFGSDLLRLPYHVDDLDADAVHLEKVRSHSLQHDLPVDIDHVCVTNLASIHHVGHLHARMQFIGLRLHSKDADLAGLEIVNDFLWKIAQRSRRQVLQHPRAI